MELWYSGGWYSHLDKLDETVFLCIHVKAQVSRKCAGILVEFEEL